MSAGGGDPEPKSTPSDLGVGGTTTFDRSDRDRTTTTETDTESTATPAAPTTPPADGTGGSTATPVAPAPQGEGGGVGQAPAAPAPAPPEGEGGGAEAPVPYPGAPGRRSARRRPPEPGRRRSRLVSPRRRFDSARLRREAPVGFVARRGRCTVSALSRRPRRRSTASSRLRAWLRVSWATARTTGPRRELIRCRCSSLSACDEQTSNTASTREAVTFACCPPGPDERLVRSSISESGIAACRPMRSGSSMAAAR